MTPDEVPDPRPRGDATREALVAAALEVFGRDGFHGASTRALAQAAGVNQALIGYHFGGKQGLYLAVFERVADGLRREMGPTIVEVHERLAGLKQTRGGAAERHALALELLEQVLVRFVEALSSPESAGWGRLIVREQQDPTEAFDLLYGGFMERGLDLIAQLVRTLQPRLSRRDVRLLVMTLVGQVLVFRVAREAVRRQLGWENVEAKEIRAIQRRIRENCRALFARGRSE